MKKVILCVATIVILSVTTVRAEEVVLFDAATASPASFKSYNGGRLELKDGVLEIAANGKSGFPGVYIKGKWDLSKCNCLTLEMMDGDTKGSLPVVVRLDNPDAKPGWGQSVFRDRVHIDSKSPTVYSLTLPSAAPNVWEIHQRLMHDGLVGVGRSKRKGLVPIMTSLMDLGEINDIDLKNVIGVALYLERPKLDRQWKVKRIVADMDPNLSVEVPDWLNMSPDEFFPFIDEYGQLIHKDWPGKIHTDADLKAALKKEETDLATHPGPKGWNKYGGWADGPKYKATGHFRVEKIDGKWWMIDPEGCLFWSHGPVRITTSSAVTNYEGREHFFANLPKPDSPLALFYTTHDPLLWPHYTSRKVKCTYDFSSANAYRKYGDDWEAQYTDISHRRLRSWGMNTLANGTDIRICRQDRTPYAGRFELRSPIIAGAELFWEKFKDPFHPEFRANFRKRLLARKAELDDPWCLGFFVENEIAWGGPTSLAEWTLVSPATQPAKIEFVAWLKKKYGNIEKLNAAWQTDYADWDALLQSTKKPGPRTKQDCLAFTKVITEEYFKRIREEFKAVAPDVLYLGCRFAGSTEASLRIGAKYCDVISYNIYRPTLDSFKLPKGLDKPVMIGEFHFGALDRGLLSTSQVEVANQEERGKAYVKYVTSALRHPNVIGAHWHQYGDQATTGRFDGENFQNGLLDVCDTPYWETIAGVREVGYQMYEIRSEKK